MTKVQMYFELWRILWNWKKTTPFSTDEFRKTFRSTSPRKIIYDMRKLGYLKRKKRNSYIVVSPKEIVNIDYKEKILNSYTLLKKAGMKYALTNVDAVMKWTKGGYNADRFFGFYPIHIKIRKSDLRKWKNFFKKHKKEFFIQGSKMSGTFLSVFYVLYPKDKFKVVKKDGDMTIPLNETINFAIKNITTFEHALEMLDEMYRLNLRVKYSTYR